MSCQEFRHDLTAYLDEELPGPRADAVESHLSGCPACRREVDGLSKSFELLALLPGPTARPGFVGRFRRRARHQRPARRLHWAAPTALAAAVLLVLALLLLPGDEPAEGPLAAPPADPAAPERARAAGALTDAERAIVRDLDVLGSDYFDEARQYEMLDRLPAIEEVDEASMEVVAGQGRRR